MIAFFQLDKHKKPNPQKMGNPPDSVSVLF